MPRSNNRQADGQRVVKPERPVCLICTQEYVLEYVLAAVGMVARRKEGGSVYKSASCGAWVPSLPEPVWVGVCMCVSRDSQATTNLIELANHSTQPASSLDPCAAPVAPPPPSLHADHLLASMSQQGRQTMRSQKERARKRREGGKNAWFVGGPAVHVSERLCRTAQG